MRVRLGVAADNAGARTLLTTSPHESFLVRLLADGMDGDAVLRRLYRDELVGPSFPNADAVAWVVRTDPTSEHAMDIEIIGSGYWLDALEHTQHYESNAYADDPAAPLVHG